MGEHPPGDPGPSGAFAAARARLAADHPVRLIVLGERQRGDDAVGFVAAEVAMDGLAPGVAARVEIRETGQLDPADLVELAEGGGAVVVDAVVGVPMGEVVVLSLGAVAGAATDPGTAKPVARSSHVLPLEQLVALAVALRGAPPPGVLVGLGCGSFGLGEPMSPIVVAAVPAFAAAIRSEIERLVAAGS